MYLFQTISAELSSYLIYNNHFNRFMQHDCSSIKVVVNAQVVVNAAIDSLHNGLTYYKQPVYFCSLYILHWVLSSNILILLSAVCRNTDNHAEIFVFWLLCSLICRWQFFQCNIRNTPTQCTVVVGISTSPFPTLH